MFNFPQRFIGASVLLFIIPLVEVQRPIYYVLKEEWICYTKLTCLDCLKLTYCSWCKTETNNDKPNCFSPKLTKNFCANDTIAYENYDLSFEGNAKCSCSHGQFEHVNCRPHDAAENVPDCSGRGKCVCGRCVCNKIPDPQHTTKTIVGEYCEYDNFSCDGPDCNEGPYALIPASVAAANSETESFPKMEE